MRLSAYTLKVMSIVAAIFLPIVLAYLAWTYRVFCKRWDRNPGIDLLIKIRCHCKRMRKLRSSVFLISNRLPGLACLLGGILLQCLWMSMDIDPLRRILVTGATGYIGGRLVPRLLAEGVYVRVLARNPALLQGRSWQEKVEVLEGDALNEDVLSRAMAGMDAAYYLIHSMSAGRGFHRRDLTMARRFGQAARSANVKRIIYLGGLGGRPDRDLSQHLRSRHQVGRVLAESGIPVIEFRAAVVVGSGSAAFEMMRYPVEGMPILFCPTWVRTRI
jgi:hypothetical protein